METLILNFGFINNAINNLFVYILEIDQQNIFSYADDIVILTPTVTNIKYIINTVEEFRTYFNFSFSQ